MRFPSVAFYLVVLLGSVGGNAQQTGQAQNNTTEEVIILGPYRPGNSVYAVTNSNRPFARKTTANGLGTDLVYSVYAVGDTVYAATDVGLSISTNGGQSFTTRSKDDGLGYHVRGIYAVGKTVYAATETGLGISTNGGHSFTKKTTANGLGSDLVLSVCAAGKTVYAATSDGLAVSTDGGQSFTNKTMANSLGNNSVRGVYVVGKTVYAATSTGLSISTNEGR